MKTLKSTFFGIILLSTLFSCNAQNSKDASAKISANENIEVYYFHYTKRCVTCNAVESETKGVLEANYADKMSDGTVSFVSLNLDEKDAKKVAESLKVSGQTLLLVKGEQQINLTNDGFMNARTNPGKFHDILKSQIDKLL